MILSGWRISSSEFASSPSAMMSGEGAYLHGGRWNSKGNRVVYLGTSLAQASIELLVHLNRTDILRSYFKMQVTFDESLVLYIDPEDLPSDWCLPTMASSVQRIGDNWLEDQQSPLLQVPSAAVGGEFNYLFNPSHPDSSKAIFGLIMPFDYDPRLLKV